MRPRTEAPSQAHRQERAALLCLLLCLGLLLLDRWLILHQFGYRYVDDDQAIMWNGAMEMAQGRFHEPCFYGQRYNTMLEGLLAVPLLWAGIGPEVALPSITSLLTLFPFLLVTFALARQRSYLLAAFVLVLPVTLPPEFGMISSMPRGFVTGIFLSSLAVLPLFSDRSIALFVSPFFAILALFANPNAALVLAPAGLLILLKYHSDRRYYLLTLAGAIPGALLYYLAIHFYEVRPHYQVHFPWDLHFKGSDIGWKAVGYMNEVSPLLWGKGWSVFVFLGVLVVALARASQWKPAIALLAGAVLLVVSFGVNKVHDGIPSVFFPWARMFLAIPFLLALFVAQLNWRPPTWGVLLMPMLAAGFFGFKCLVQNTAVERQIATLKLNYMEAREVDELKRYCLRIDELARRHQAGLLVISWSRNKHLTNYGCPCLIPEFPLTMEPHLDRRTWWLQAVATQVVPNVLFSGIEEASFRAAPSPLNGASRVSEEPLLYLVKGNTQRTDSILDRLRIGMRSH